MQRMKGMDLHRLFFHRFGSSFLSFQPQKRIFDPGSVASFSHLCYDMAESEKEESNHD